MCAHVRVLACTAHSEYEGMWWVGNGWALESTSVYLLQNKKQIYPLWSPEVGHQVLMPSRRQS